MPLSRSKRKYRLQSPDILLTPTPNPSVTRATETRATQIAENPVRSVGRVCRPLARLHRLRLGSAQRAANLLVLPHALESLFKLRDQRSYARLDAALFHNAPEKIASRPLVRIVDGQQIFGGPTRHKDDDIGF